MISGGAALLHCTSVRSRPRATGASESKPAISSPATRSPHSPTSKPLCKPRETGESALAREASRRSQSSSCKSSKGEVGGKTKSERRKQKVVSRVVAWRHPTRARGTAKSKGKGDSWTKARGGGAASAREEKE